MKKTLLGLALVFSLLGACSDDDDGSAGTAGSGGSTAGSSSGGSGGSGGSGTAGSGTAGSGQAGTGTAGSGTAGSGTAGSGDAGSGGAAAGAGGDAGSAGSGAGGGSGSDKVAGCNADNAEDMTAVEAMVMREGFTYKPACLKIKKGKSVMFMANSSTHPLKGMDQLGTQPNPLQGPFTSDETVTYPDTGIFGFYCTNHGSQLADKDAAGMAGAVVVVE